MRYAFYLGCTTPVRALKYEISTRNLAKKLDIELVDIPEFGCCGFPVKSMDFLASLIMAARNLSLAEEMGLDIVGICTGCMAILSEAREHLKDEYIRDKVNKKLRALGVREYRGDVRVRHLARVLYEDYGLESLKERVVRPLETLRLGIHYGCHYLKPTSAHGRFDDPTYPVTLDALISITGAEAVDYPNKGLCCGITIIGTQEDLAFKLTAEKLMCLTSMGVDAMVVACPSCCIAYENNQRLAGKRTNSTFNLPVLYFTQIMGLSMGIDRRELGFEFNRISADSIA